jgi:Flp pilus assembly protein TadD
MRKPATLFFRQERVMGIHQRRECRQSLVRPSSLAVAVALASILGGCANKPQEVTGSINPSTTQLSDSDWRQRAETLAAQYQRLPNDPGIAVAYAQALRATGQRARAAAVLQQASIRNPKNQAVLGAYGRALADVGQYAQALEVLGSAHTPDQPDWRILNVQGAVLDQMGNHAEARRYYQTALKIAPEEPAILSNLGLSYMLSKDLKRAEATLRRAAADSHAEPKVRQNLALVLGLRGKFEEAERVTGGVLSADQARANVTYLREMRETGRRKTSAGPKDAAAG